MGSVKFGKFKANKAGYSAVKNSSAVQSILRGKAERVRSQAVSMAGGNGEVRGPARRHPKDIIAYPGSDARSARFRSTAAISAPTRRAPQAVVTQLRAAALTPARAAQVLPVVEPKKAAEAALRIAAMGLNKALA